VMDYADLAANPTDLIYDQAIGNGNGNILIPSYRTHVHYGTVGTVFAGVGGVEFDGSLSWASSPHTTKATCQNCHMADMNGAAGGHSFWAKGNFKGCNVTDCHASAPLDDKSAKVVDTQKAIKKLLDDLAAEINAVGGGTDILHKDPENLWAASTTNHYDGYLDMYDAGSNPSGYWQNPNPSTSWTDAQKTENLGKPLFPSLTKGVLGAMINFQMALREASLGMHNTAYTKALLQNSIDAI